MAQRKAGRGLSGLARKEEGKGRLALINRKGREERRWAKVDKGPREDREKEKPFAFLFPGIFPGETMPFFVDEYVSS